LGLHPICNQMRMQCYQLFNRSAPVLLTMLLSSRALNQSFVGTVAAFSKFDVVIRKNSKSNVRPTIHRLYSSEPKTSKPKLLGPDDFPDWAYEPRDFFRFEILHESTKSQARVGRIHTPHGTIDTPGYVAVATNAALKGVDFRDADKVRTISSDCCAR